MSLTSTYQYCLVYAYEQVDEELKSLQPFRNAAAYAKEFGNYESGSSDNDYDYYMQACETDARLYSEDVTYEYFKKIEDYALLEELDEPAE